MKQINGTVTLSFLEEDNQQRVIFRVIPLCTREGVAFRDKPIDFPDAGSLRIVPDKREQSTFKERMRSMGSLCAIHLVSEGKELAKVRQNRNYDPGQGEVNQFAIYSDVICEFAEEGIFEVFTEGADIAGALSPRVLIRRGQVLYGPVARDAAVDMAALRPFGNDSYLLHTAQMPGGEDRTFYWNPELTVSWRQRRGTLRRGKGRPEEMDEAVETEVETAPSQPTAERLTERSRTEAPRSVDAPAEPREAQARKPERPQQPSPAPEVRPAQEAPRAEAPRRMPVNERRRDAEATRPCPSANGLPFLTAT